MMVGVVVGIVLGVVFVRHVENPLSRSIAADESVPKMLGAIGVITVLATLPTALFAYGLAMWINTLGVPAVSIDCQIRSATHSTRKGRDAGWNVSYACELDGEKMNGYLWTLTEPPAKEGEPTRFVAARGRLGIWIRQSDPLVSTAKPTP